MGDWLFQDLPGGEISLLTEAATARAKVEADPAAAAISDEEAEHFFGVAWSLRFLSEPNLRHLGRAFGVQVGRGDPKARRRVVLAVLKQWNNPRYHELLRVVLFPNSGLDRFPPPADAHGSVSIEDLAAAYHQRYPLLWLVHYMRHLGYGDAVPEFIRGLNEWAALELQFWLDISRLTMRRLLGGRGQSSAPAQARADVRRLQEQLREQAAVGQALEQDKQRLERTRQDLARRAKRSEAASADLVARARAEAAAARQELERRRQAHAREQAEAAAKHAAATQTLQRKIAQARQELAAALAERAVGTGAAPLRGLTVAVRGGADPESYRLLVESAGGKLVEGGADLTVLMQAGDDAPSAPGLFCTPEEGLAAFERVLRRQILPALARRRG